MPVYDNKFIETRIKGYNNKINTHLQGNKMPEDNKSLSTILLDYIINVDEKY